MRSEEVERRMHPPSPLPVPNPPTLPSNASGSPPSTPVNPPSSDPSSPSMSNLPLSSSSSSSSDSTRLPVSTQATDQQSPSNPSSRGSNNNNDSSRRTSSRISKKVDRLTYTHDSKSSQLPSNNVLTSSTGTDEDDDFVFDDPKLKALRDWTAG